MSELLRFFKDMRDNGYGLAEIAAQLGTSAIAEPVAGFAAMYDPAHGADAIREGMTYQPRSQAAQEYSQSVGNAAKTAIKPAMPIIDTWKKGVDIAGQYSPVAGAALRTVPTAIGIAMGAKPALQAGRQASESLGAMQARMIANANAPRTLNTGYMGQRGTFAGINALTADKEALTKAQQMIAQGVDPAQVWKETGWGKGVDGKWRFEINDKFDITDDGKTIGSSLDYNNGALPALAYGDIGVARGQQILNHNDLYEAYPDLKMMEIRAARDVMGEFDNNNQIRLNHSLLSNAVGGRDLGDTVNAHSILMHELQHKIQQTENFAKGGNPDQFKELLPNAESLQDARVMASLLRRGSTVDSVGQDFTNMIGRYPHNGATDLVRNLSPDDIHKMTADPKKAYRQLAGEVEARTTQSRMDLNAQQRRENYPFDYRKLGYDVPAKSQIVDFGNNKANAQRPLTEFEQAHLTAQRNAALPVNQGGLGLAPGNTAMDRARAMGFDVDNPVYHGTNWDVREFDLSRSGSSSGAEQYGTGVYTATNPTLASGYANPRMEGANVLPLVTRMANPISDQTVKKLTKAQIKKIIEQSPDLDEHLWNYGDVGYEGKNSVLNKAVNQTYDYQRETMLESLHPIANDFFSGDPVAFNNAAAKVLKKDGVIVDFPKTNEKFNIPWSSNQVRSRFAAFDPFNRDSSNLLAQSAKLAPTTALGAYMYNEKRKKSQGNQ